MHLSKQTAGDYKRTPNSHVFFAIQDLGSQHLIASNIYFQHLHVDHRRRCGLLSDKRRKIIVLKRLIEVKIVPPHFRCSVTVREEQVILITTLLCKDENQTLLREAGQALESSEIVSHIFYKIHMNTPVIINSNHFSLRIMTGSLTQFT